MSSESISPILPILPDYDEGTLFEKFNNDLEGRFNELTIEFKQFGDHFWEYIKLNSTKCLVETYLQALKNIKSNTMPLDLVNKNIYIGKQLDLVFSRYYDKILSDPESKPLFLIIKLLQTLPEYSQMIVHVSSAILTILVHSDYYKFL